MKKIITILIAFALCGMSANSQTNVSGGIYSSTTWTLNNSPYIVTGTVVVFPNVILTIEPGVVVKFDNTIGIEIRQAMLIANGTATDSITFTSNSNSPVVGIYPGIYLNGGSLTSTFDYCNFQFAKIGINVKVIDTVMVNNSDFSQDSIGLQFITANNGYAQTAIIGSTTFNNNTIGLDLEDIRYASTYLCHFSYNSTVGFRLGNPMGADQSFQATTNSCVFTNNNTGMQIMMETSSMIYCNFSNNNMGLSGGTGQATNHYVYPNSVSNSIFYYNQSGISVVGMLIDSCTVNENQNGITGGGLNRILNCTINLNSIVGISSGSDTIGGCQINYNGIGIQVNYHENIYKNTIEYNTNANIEAIGNYDVEIRGNAIRNSPIGINDSSYNGGYILITDNIIENNNLGIRIANSSNTIISCNTICNSTTYALRYEGTNNVDASHNYWCITDSATLETLIYDGYDNINYGLVAIMPMDTIGCNISTGINSPSSISNSSISIFPNPATTTLTIHQTQSTHSTNQLIITDVMGNEIYSQPINNSTESTIDISTLSNGIYFYEVRGSELQIPTSGLQNPTSVRGKFMVQK